MINIQSNFRAIAIPVRHHLTDCVKRVIEQNRRFFAKAASFPCVLLVENLWRFRPFQSQCCCREQETYQHRHFRNECYSG